MTTVQLAQHATFGLEEQIAEEDVWAAGSRFSSHDALPGDYLENMPLTADAPATIWVDGHQYILVLGGDGRLKYLKVNEKDQVVRGFDLTNFLPKVPYCCEEGVESHTCSVCLEDLRSGDMISPLRCKHQFHHTCISSWLTSRVRVGQIGCCPNCNYQVCSPVFEARATSSSVTAPVDTVGQPRHLQLPRAIERRAAEPAPTTTASIGGEAHYHRDTALPAISTAITTTPVAVPVKRRTRGSFYRLFFESRMPRTTPPISETR
jgi:hypothetical protein